MLNYDIEYRYALHKILHTGYEYLDPNRKGVKRKELGFLHLKFKADAGYPILTLRRVPFKNAVSELILFLKGVTDIREYWKQGIKFWDQDVLNFHNLESFDLAVEHQFDMGKIYPYQYRKLQGIDQIDEVFTNFKNNPMRTDLVVTAWNPTDLKNMCLKPCFVENTPVCTIDEYKNIQDVKVGDLVLTKEGNYKRVYETMITDYKGTLIGLDVKGTRDIIKCTPNHEFYIKDKGWVQSLFIEENDYLGIPVNKESVIPEFTYENKIFREKEITFKLESKDEWFMLGYFVGDGWVSTGKDEICFAISDKESDYIIPKLNNVFNSLKKSTKSGASYKYKAYSKKYSTVLRLFGHKAINKKIPSFVHNAPLDLIEEFLNGYYMADGCKTKRQLNYGTVSHNLAFGIQLLGAKLGKTFTVSYKNNSTYYTILGRSVKQAAKYYQTIENKPCFDIIVDKDFIWYKVINVYNYKDIKCKVYNFSVEESHTYTVYNFATHNCHHLFQIVGENDGFNIVFNMKGVDLVLGFPVNIQYYYLMGKILEQWSGYRFKYLVANLNKVHIYDNQYELAEQLINSEGSEVQPNLQIQNIDNTLSAFDLVESLDKSMFTLHNYFPDERLKPVKMLAYDN